jgi:general secretion pathway protein A
MKAYSPKIKLRFYKGLLDQLGLESRFYRGDSKRQLQQEIEIIRGVRHQKVVCILDEAHLLEKETLEEFRFLLNYRFDSMSPMVVVLVGQTELWDNKLKLQKYSAIRQRIDMYCTLPHLDRAETEQYVNSYLEYAGWDQRSERHPQVPRSFLQKLDFRFRFNSWKICRKHYSISTNSSRR